MSKILKTLFITVLSVFLLSCGFKENEKLVIGVSPVPHKEIVELIADDLSKDGIDLEIVIFNDYVQPNLALADKSLDANFFQHEPYMKNFAMENGIFMTSVGSVHLEPLKIYSNKIKNINEIKNLDRIDILIPNDFTNQIRALTLLRNAGVIKLKDNNKVYFDIDDIDYLDGKINIKELNSEHIASKLNDCTIAVINTNNALESNITKDKAIFVEEKDLSYANVVTVLQENENSEKIKKLINLLQSEKVKQFINKKYNGEIVPAF